MKSFSEYGIGRSSFYTVMVLALFLLGMAVGCESLPQEKPAPQISSDIPADVREQIKNLYAPDARSRAIAAAKLRKMGARSIPAMPYLLDLLGNETAVTISRGSFRMIILKTTPGKEAALTLGSFGEIALQPLVDKLRDPDPRARENAVWSLGIMSDKRAVGPLEELSNDPDERVRKVARWAIERILKGEPLMTSQEQQFI